MDGVDASKAIEALPDASKRRKTSAAAAASLKVNDKSAN